MKALLGSGGIRTEGRRELYRKLMAENFTDCERVVFIPFASNDYNGYTSSMREFAGNTEYEIIGLHEFEDPLMGLEVADGIYVGGGNTWLLTKQLHLQKLIQPIREAVIKRKIPYAGVSAGANVASPSMQTTNDMAITMVPSFESLGIIPFQINPHYHPGGIWYREKENGDFHQHFGESRARRVSEFHELNDTPVIGLYEGAFLKCKDDEFELIGNKAAIMRKGEQILTYDPGVMFNGKLTTA
tara:strand:- start:7137 stop:7865 length:729 start_codon:yes stop_codon:yes gene_type:complete